MTCYPMAGVQEKSAASWHACPPSAAGTRLRKRKILTHGWQGDHLLDLKLVKVARERTCCRSFHGLCLTGSESCGPSRRSDDDASVERGLASRQQETSRGRQTVSPALHGFAVVNRE